VVPEPVCCARGGAVVSAATDARAILTGDDFYRESHAVIFRVAGKVARPGSPPDLVSIGDRLTDDGDLASVGGWAALHGLLDSPLTGQNVEAWARIVKDKALRRRTIEAAGLATQAALDPTVDLGSVVKNWQQAANSLGDQGGYLEDLPAR